MKRLLREIERALRPAPGRVAEARGRAKRLCAEVSTGTNPFAILRTLEHGSQARGTALAGFEDLDLLLVLDPRVLRTTRGTERTAGDTVRRLGDVVEARRLGMVNSGNLVVRRQTHSVGADYPKSGIRIDLVPAIDRGRGRFSIPSRDAGEWIDTRPGRIGKRLARAEAARPGSAAAVRLLKGWRRARGGKRLLGLPGYAIETLVVDAALRRRSGDGLDVVAPLLREIADAHKNRRLVLRPPDDKDSVVVAEPSSGENLAWRANAASRSRLIEAARKAADALDDAEECLLGRDRAGARRLLLDVFVGRRQLGRIRDIRDVY
jgi:hypothetical protein